MLLSISPARPLSPRPDQRNYGHQFSLARQLEVITEMLDSMDTLTIAGQRHTMGKVVEFIKDQMAHAPLPFGLRNQQMLAELLRQLRDESQRLSPDVLTFTRGAKSLVALLNGVA